MQALTILLNIISGIISWFFTVEIVPGVTLGWVFLSVLIAGFLIKSFLKESNNE